MRRKFFLRFILPTTEHAFFPIAPCPNFYSLASFASVYVFSSDANLTDAVCQLSHRSTQLYLGETAHFYPDRPSFFLRRPHRSTLACVYGCRPRGERPDQDRDRFHKFYNARIRAYLIPHKSTGRF